MGVSNLAKFRLLLWKNYILQARHKVQTVLEIVIPLIFVAVLVGTRSIIDSKPYDGYEFPAWGPDDTNATAMAQNVKSQALIPGFKPFEIWYAPNGSEIVEDVIKIFEREFLQEIEYVVRPENGTVFIGNISVIGFEDAASLEKKYESTTTGPTGPKILCGIIFNKVEKGGIDYTLRFKPNLEENIEGTVIEGNDKWFTELIYPVFPFLGPRMKDDPYGGSPGYHHQGFTYVQYGLDASLMAHFGNAAINGSVVNNLKLRMQRYPFPAFIDDRYLVALQGWFPLILMLSFLYPMINITKAVVVEKERKLKESMKMMGLPNYMHWGAWFLKSFLFLLLSTIFMTVLLKVEWYGDGLAVLTFCNPFILFIFLISYVFSTICLAFLVSTLFSKANSASTAAGVIWFLFYFPYFFLQPRYDQLSLGGKLMPSLLQNTAMAFGCQIISMFEGTGVGSQWSNINKGVSPQDDFSLLQCIIMLLLDGVLSFLLAIYIEGVRPGEFGVPLPWYFPFSKTYWVGSNAQKSGNIITPAGTYSKDDEEPPPRNGKAGIRIMGLTKRFGKKTAVNNLVLDMYEDQITALLGHNGAGKTTTMSMLTGLLPPSSGTAVINNFDIRTNIKEVRDSLGLCPQHDVLFDEMTVEEHLRFFCQLKGHDNIDAEVTRMINAVGLEPKRHAQAQTLSGGMKRKLSVGIALVGGSRVVLLDEPTSGMDPGARRATWDLLVSEKKHRTILLSTHFMDEADLLGDRIAIMAEGELQTVGSSLFLKKRFGGGYHLVVVKQSGCDVDKITGILRKHLGEATIEQDVGAELSYSLSDEKSRLFADMFEELEQRRQELKIDSYGASITTMEEVFMRVGKAAEERKHQRNTGEAMNVSMETLQKDGSQYQLYEKHVVNTGISLLFQQLRAMIVKKALYASRNRILLAIQTIIPVAFLIIALIMINTLPGILDNPKLELELKPFGSDTDTFLECGDGALPEFCDVYKDLATERGTRIIESSNVTGDILKASEKDLGNVNYKKIISMQATGDQLTALFNNQPLHAQPITLNYMTTALYRVITNEPAATIKVANHPFKFTLEETAENAAGPGSVGFQVGFNIAFGMSFLAASFVVFLIKERESKAKHLQYVSGVKFWVFWIANFLFDMINYLIPCLCLIIVLLAFQAETFTSGTILFYVFLLFLFYGWAVIPLMYLFSFWFSIPSSGFTRMTMINVITGMAPILAITILMIPDLDLLDTAEILDWIFMIFPQYNLGYGIVSLSTNVLYHDYCPLLLGSSISYCDVPDNANAPCCDKYDNGYLAWNAPGIGRNLFFLFLIGVISWIILFVAESKILSKIFQKKSEKDDTNYVKDETEESDVAAEAARIRNTNLTQLYKTDNLILRNLKKSYGSFTAVKCLNLGVQQRECFGLLGVNGAGKTTTFKMLTGDLSPTAGDAFIYSHSITSNIKEVQKNLGYCPQFDAIIEELTGRETIRLFARLRGIREAEIDSLVDKLGANLLFTEHMEKRCGSYSGGNKRKLSTALALVGNPPIVFLDEPTTGMDPVARRHLWNCISNVRDAGTSIVLTSHSMEECEALCTRLAIMVNGEFKCLGSTQHLKSKFGEGYTVIAQMASKAPVTKSSLKTSNLSANKKQSWEIEIEPLQKFITQSFRGATLKDVHPGYVHYHVTDASISWGYLFRQMEVAKREFNLEAYSVGQTSLEQVFLTFAKNQIVDE